MGLTIHYSLKTAGDARALVQQLHQAARDLPFKEVGEIVELRDCRVDRRDLDNPNRWLLIQAQAGINAGDAYVPVIPDRIIAFSIRPGDGCEEANFGLCQYPSSVEHQGRQIKTLLKGWSWRSFVKTQYASDPQCGGIANFLRCHLGIVALLDKAKLLGCLDSVRDEGGFWEARDVKALVPGIESWNQMIAAFAGQLKDNLGGVEAPITQFGNFEHLEMAGQDQLPRMQELTRLIKQVVNN